MLDDLSVVEKSIEEILIELMVVKVMSIGAQASSTRGLQESSSNPRQFGSSPIATKKRNKHRNDLVNAKLILSVLPNYILPLASAVRCDNVPRDLDYTLITTYLPKVIRVVGL
jgi:hypothetical protein